MKILFSAGLKRILLVCMLYLQLNNNKLRYDIMAFYISPVILASNEAKHFLTMLLWGYLIISYWKYFWFL